MNISQNIILIIGSLFVIVTEVFKKEISNCFVLATVRAYVSIFIFVLFGWIFVNNHNLISIVFYFVFISFLIVRNTWAVIKSYKLSNIRINMHIAIANIIQIIIGFAIIYQLIYSFNSNSFNGISKVSGIDQYIDFIYFSFVTFTTVGYGDIQPITSIAKIAVICEIIVFFFGVSLIVNFIIKKRRG